MHKLYVDSTGMQMVTVPASTLLVSLIAPSLMKGAVLPD